MALTQLAEVCHDSLDQASPNPYMSLPSTLLCTLPFPPSMPYPACPRPSATLSGTLTHARALAKGC